MTDNWEPTSDSSPLDRAALHSVIRTCEDARARRDRAPIATWLRRYYGHGELTRQDYPPGALARNPPGFWTPEAHP